MSCLLCLTVSCKGVWIADLGHLVYALWLTSHGISALTSSSPSCVHTISDVLVQLLNHHHSCCCCWLVVGYLEWVRPNSTDMYIVSVVWKYQIAVLWSGTIHVPLCFIVVPVYIVCVNNASAPRLLTQSSGLFVVVFVIYWRLVLVLNNVQTHLPSPLSGSLCWLVSDPAPFSLKWLLPWKVCDELSNISWFCRLKFVIRFLPHSVFCKMDD